MSTQGIRSQQTYICASVRQAALSKGEMSFKTESPHFFDERQMMLSLSPASFISRNSRK